LELPLGLDALNTAVHQWMNTIANVRIHGETRKQPTELFALEKPHLKALPPIPADTGVIDTVPANNRFRVRLDTNRYSVPSRYASQRLTLKTFADRLCIYHDQQLIATHTRSYDRHRDFENPDHAKELLQQRTKARNAKLLLSFYALCPRAEEYYRQLQERRLNPRLHIAKIMALSEVYGPNKVARAIEDPFEFAAFSSDYIANILPDDAVGSCAYYRTHRSASLLCRRRLAKRIVRAVGFTLTSQPIMEREHRDPNPHDQRHDHGTHSHALAPKNFSTAFALGFALNIGFVVVQVAFGLLAHSLALVADAGHNLGDGLGLLMAWLASYLGTRPATERRTYGMRRSSILAALANSILLLIAVGGISWEAIRRFREPAPVAGWTVIWVAFLGIFVNLITALLFRRETGGDLNIRGAFLHMMADSAVSAGVVVAGLLILLTAWNWLDPTVSLLINGVILWGTWGLLRDSMNLALDAVPERIDTSAVTEYLASLPAVTGVHHLHIWPLSTTETALTVHLVKPMPENDDDLIRQVSHELSERFQIVHTTIQLERGTLCSEK
jgi:cobalt-zinc-cadmium efflux system protein